MRKNVCVFSIINHVGKTLNKMIRQKFYGTDRMILEYKMNMLVKENWNVHSSLKNQSPIDLTNNDTIRVFPGPSLTKQSS